MTQPTNSMTEATHAAGGFILGFRVFIVLLALAAFGLVADYAMHLRPIDHVDEHCIYYADQRAPMVTCTVEPR